MKAILVVDIDDSYIPIKKESVILKRGTITYRDLNNNPYSIEINNFCLKPIPDKYGGYNRWLDEPGIAYDEGWNDCIEAILGDEK